MDAPPNDGIGTYDFLSADVCNNKEEAAKLIEVIARFKLKYGPTDAELKRNKCGCQSCSIKEKIMESR